MEQPKFFTHTKPETASAQHNYGKTIWKIFVLMLGIIVIGYLLFRLFVFGRQFSDNWTEIWFAYSKPAIVKTVRLQYQQKQTALDKEFTQPANQQSMQDQVKQAVAQEMQAEQAKVTPPTTPYFR